MLQRHNITGSEVKTRDQNVPGYGAMRAANRMRRQPRGWLVPALLVLLIVVVVVLIGIVATR